MKGKEDSPVQTFLRLYSRKFSKLGLTAPAEFDAKARQWAADDEIPLQVHLSGPIGPNAAAIIFDSMKRAGIQSIRSFRLWKCDAKNEGIRVLSEMIKISAQVEVIDLLDNEIDELGCEFLSRSLDRGCQLKKLLLDHNPIGEKGFNFLSRSIATLPNLEELSLAFCGLKKESSSCIQQILLFRQSRLQILNVSYNSLETAGCYACFKALEINTYLREINLRHNEIIEDVNLAEKLLKIIVNHCSLTALDISCNSFSEALAEKICEAMISKMTMQIDMGDDFSSSMIEKLRNASMRVQANNKRVKGKKEPKKAAR